MAPFPLELIDHRIFFSLQKVFFRKSLFSLMARPLPPPPLLNGLAISGETYFAASLSLVTYYFDQIEYTI